MIWTGDHAGFQTAESSQENKSVSARNTGDVGSFSMSAVDSLGHTPPLFICLFI